MHWHKISAVIGGSVAENKRKLSYREFVKWADFFEWEAEQRNKQENYLARIIYLLERQVFKNPAEMKDCFCPPLSEKELEMSGGSDNDDGILDSVTGWAALEAAFGKKGE